MAESAPLPPTPAAHHRLTRSVARGLRQPCGVRAGAHLLVAVSGGADSVALLRALASLADRRRWQLMLSVGHVQHHLRGDAAEADARFVEALAGELRLHHQRVDLNPSAIVGNVEAWARQQRYAALAQMAHTCGARYLVTAHQADDQLETLLMRMLRGTSVRGLRGIAWRRRFRLAVDEVGRKHEADLKLIRPMLGVMRADVIDFLQAIGQRWREDHTNADVTRDRARLRREVLPVLRELRHDAAARAVQLADHAHGVHRLVQHEIARQREQLVHETEGGWMLPRDELRGLPRVVLMGLLRSVLRKAGVPGDRLTRRALTPLTRAVRDRRGGERSFELAGGVRVMVRRDGVRIERA